MVDTVTAGARSNGPGLSGAGFRWRTRMRAHVVAACVLITWTALAHGHRQYWSDGWGWLAVPVAVLAFTVVAARPVPRPAGSVAIASGATVALAAWSTLSILWARYDPTAAWRESMLGLCYVAIAIVAWTLVTRADDLRRVAWWIVTGVTISMAPLVVRMLAGTAGTAFERGRISWPVDYANADAAIAIFVACLALGVSASTPPHNWQRHAVLGACAGVLIALAAMTQSRSAAIALVTALAVHVWSSPRSSSAAVRAASLPIAAALVWPLLDRPFEAWRAAAASGRAPANLPTAGAALGVLIASGIVTLWWIAAAMGRTGSDRGDRPRVSPLALWLGIVALALTMLVWGGRQTAGCVRTPASSTRALDARDVLAPPDQPRLLRSGSARCQFWSVSLGALADRPLLGVGFGNFQGRYAARRASDALPSYAHSRIAEAAGELGAPGLALLLTAIAATTVALVATRTAPAIRLALPALASWMVFSAIDFTWHVVAATALATFVLAATLRSAAPPDRAALLRARWVLPLILSAVAGTVPLAIAERETDIAVRTASTSPLRALTRLDRAAHLAPLWSEPLLQRARIEVDMGRSSSATSSTLEAIGREPHDWRTQAIASSVLERAGRTRRARAARTASQRLNIALQ